MRNWKSLIATGVVLSSLPIASSAQDKMSMPEVASSTRAPKAVICVSIDQFRRDYLDRCLEYMGEDGFRRFYDKGAISPDCAYEFAFTVTSAGHATLMTGVNPNIHGIVENGFYVYEERGLRYSVEDSGSPLVNETGKFSARGASPKRLLVDTVGDELERATNGAAKTFSIAAKDRSAVLMAGHKPDEVYWFSSGEGKYVSSQYYMEKTPAWLNDYQAKHGINQWVGKEWGLLKEKEIYEKLCTIDAQEGEASWGLPNTMPKQLLPVGGVPYNNQFAVTPFADQYTMEVAIAGMRALEIGQDEVPDLVTISLSAFDKGGHAWGPDSWEMIDAAFRMDNTIAMMFEFLDEYIGDGNYEVILSADHGVAPLPEVSHERGETSGRLRTSDILTGLQGELQRLFPDTNCAGYETDMPYVYLQPPCSGENAEEFLRQMKRWLSEQEGIGAVFTREELEAQDAKPGTILYAAQQSYHPNRSGHLMIVLDRNYILMPGEGTTHYTPYDYDQDVPLLAYGPSFGAKEGPEILKEATSPTWMARLSRRVLGLNETPDHRLPDPNPAFSESGDGKPLFEEQGG